MKKLTGIICIVLGVLLLLGSAGLLIYNQQEDQQALQTVKEVMPKLVVQIQKEQQSGQTFDPYDPTMKQVEIDGHAYVGFVTIPELKLELPVMSDWNDAKMRISPCVYHGSYKSDDFVILAHSYPSFFGKIGELQVGDLVMFTDMDGITTQYQVMAQDVLSPYAVEEMNSGEFDLTLFTCTYGGGNRITVRCDRTQEE